MYERIIHGRQVELRSHYVAKALIDGEFEIECRWNGSSIGNDYVGGKEVDCFTNYEMKTAEDFEEYFLEWLGYQFELEDAE